MNKRLFRTMTAGKLAVLGMCLAAWAGAVPGALTAEGRDGAADAPATVTIPAGTKIPVRVNENIDGAGQAEGKLFEVYTADLVRTDGTVAIPAGTLLHATIARSPKPPDHVLALYSVRLVDLELRGETYLVVADTYDIPVDPATDSPYREPATGTILAADTILLFTLKSPLTIKGDE